MRGGVRNDNDDEDRTQEDEGCTYRDVRTHKTRSVVQSNPHTGGLTKDFDRARVGHETCRRILGRDAALHGVSGTRDLGLIVQSQVRQTRTGSDAKLGLYEIDSSHLLGHGMFDLIIGKGRGIVARESRSGRRAK